MRKLHFLKKYTVSEGTIVHCDECKYCFYPVKEEEVLLAEQKLSLRFPESLREFYLDVGYGYLGNDDPEFEHMIMHPLEIVKIKLGIDFYENMPTVDSEYYTSDDVLPFFSVGSEFDYLVIQMTGHNKGSIIYCGDVVASSFEDFVEKMYNKTGYYIYGS